MTNGKSGRARRRRALLLALSALLIGGGMAPVAPARIGPAQAQEGVARIAHSDDGVLLRAEPTFGAAVLTTLPEGAVVDLRVHEVDTVYDPDGVTRWWPVRTEAGDGWVSGFYLQVAGLGEGGTSGSTETGTSPNDEQSAPAAGAPTETEQQPQSTGPVLYGSSARVAEPDGVNLREQPGVGSASVGQVAFDAVVELRIDEVDTVYVDNGRWWPVRANGEDGWILGSYLVPNDGSAVVQEGQERQSEAPPPAEGEQVQAEQTAGDAPGKTAPQVPLFSIGSYVAAITDDGTGLNIRADGAPDSERIGSIPENDVVQVMDGPYVDPTGRGWYLITDGSVTGFVDGGFLSEARQPPPPGDVPELEIPEVPEIDVDLDRPGRATGTFMYPVGSYTFTQAFGCSPYWFEPWEPAVGCNYHNGIDLAAPMGTPLMASDGGIVEYSGWCDCGLGYYVKIDHGNGFKTVYGHMSELWVNSGQAVQQGEAIGAMGSTGMSTGPHVHFMVEVNGIADDPLAYLG